MSSSKSAYNEVNDWAQRLSSANLRIVRLPVVILQMVVMIVQNVQALQMQTTTVRKFSFHITELY